MHILNTLTLLLLPLAEVVSAVPSAYPEGTMLSDDTFIVHGLEKRAQANAVTGVRNGYTGSYRVQRQELNGFITDKGGSVFNLFVLAVKFLQEKDPNDAKSWWQICSIHGRPYQGWNKEGASGNANSGYCTHQSTLFPTWHRPYLALMEQNIWNAAQVIVKNQIPGSQSAAFKKQWATALSRLRLPYWDWASNNAQMPWVLTQDQITVTLPTGQKQRIPNPLFSCKFRSGTYNNQNLFPSDPYFRWAETKRYPTGSDAGARSQNNLVQQQLAQNAAGLRQNVYQLLVNGQYNNWNAFSNKGAGQPGTSIEALHDIIHGLTGNGGHMSFVDYSSFDPIFWFHHCNIDRIFAMWQSIHSAYVSGQNNPFGTYGVAVNTWETAGTPLTPFRDPSGKLYTSWGVRETGVFGYGYADTPKWNYYGRPVDYRAFVRRRINELYGSTNRALASAAKRRKRDYVADPSNSTEVAIDKSVTNHQYYDWKVDITADKMALGGSYFVHFFLGEPSKNPKDWSSQKELVGDYVVFTSASGMLPFGTNPAGIDTRVTGSVFFTQALVDSFKDTDLESLRPEDVSDFLKENLHWRVSLMNDTSFAVDKVAGLEVTVAAAVVTVPDDDQDGTLFPEYGPYVNYPDIIGSIGKKGDPDANSSSVTSSTTSSSKPSSTVAPVYTTTAASSSASTSTAATSATSSVASSSAVASTSQLSSSSPKATNA